MFQIPFRTFGVRRQLPALPDPGETELDYRTQPNPPEEDSLHAAGFLLAAGLLLVPVLAVLAFARSHVATEHLSTGLVVLGLAVVALHVITSQPGGRSIGWCLVGFLGWLVAFAFVQGVRPEHGFLLAFLPSVALLAWFSHAVAKGHAFFMTANHRVAPEVKSRWRGFWEAAWNLETPRECPAVEGYRRGFYYLVACAAAGLVAAAAGRVVLQSPFAGLVGVLGFVAALGAAWAVRNRRAPAAAVPLGEAVSVSWRGIVVLLTYNRHGSEAPCIFRFPSPVLRSVTVRKLALGLVLFAVALGIGAALPQTAPAEARRGDARPAEDASLRSNQPQMLPHEKAFRSQLAPEKRAEYDRLIVDRRRAELAAERKKEEGFDSMPLASAGALAVIATVLCSVVAFGTYVFLAGPVLVAFHRALEAPDATEASGLPPDRVLAMRLRASSNPAERGHLFLGRTVLTDEPVLADISLLNGHAHFLGDTESRKTSLGLVPTIEQLLGATDGSILILDLKGDAAFFHTARAITGGFGVPFPFLTNVPGWASHVFNAFRQSHWPHLPTSAKTQMLLQAFDLDFGKDYGRAFFAALQEIVLRAYLRECSGLEALSNLRERMGRRLSARWGVTKDDWQKARHLVASVDRLASNSALNATPETHPGRDALFEHAIDMASLFRKRQVVYFFLDPRLEGTTVAPIAKLALFSLLTAASVLPRQGRRRVYVVIDEFQEIITRSMMKVFEQARSSGVSLLVAHQSIGQLKREPTLDLTSTVENNTALKRAFKATDQQSIERIQFLSGPALWDYATRDELGNVTSVQSRLEPSLPQNDVMALSATPKTSLVRFSEDRGLTRYGGRVVPIVSDFFISAEEYEAFDSARWPEVDERTLVVKDLPDDPDADRRGGSRGGPEDDGSFDPILSAGAAPGDRRKRRSGKRQ